MSQKPISPLRSHMLNDMLVRTFTAKTQREYIRAVKKLAAFLGRRRTRRRPRIYARSNCT